MSKIIKLKENYEFRRAYNRAKSVVCPYAVIYFMKNRSGDTRLGITAGKKLGTAVSRNRAKRVITAAFRGCLPHITKGYDFVIVARTRILTVKSTKVQTAFVTSLKNAGLYNAFEDEQITD
ncbi:MAG: ribonuclease P protein component [Clostridia bacterium]|nr:ribonuclease P protein component [Clostridia bacterium]